MSGDARWGTREFAAHYAVLAAAGLYSAWKCAALYRSHAGLLRVVPEGLLSVDVSDHQWTTMRAALPGVLIMVLAHAALGRALWHNDRLTGGAPRGRMVLRALGALLFMVVLHGLNVVKMLLVLAPFVAAPALLGRSRVLPAVVWIYALGAILFLRPLERHYLPAAPWAGLHANWTGYFNVAVLRMLSLALDRHWTLCDAYAAHDAGRCGECRTTAERAKSRAADDAAPPAAAPLPTPELSPMAAEKATADAAAPACVRERMAAPPLAVAVDEDAGLGPSQRAACAARYWQTSLCAAVAYVFYAPLHIAGPIMTYNDFCWQAARPLPPAPLLPYAARVLAAYAAIEAVCHSLMAFALRDGVLWRALRLDSAGIASVALWNLALLFLKLMVFWRLFRLGALLDRVQPVENMARFFLNCPSPAGFWRAWHRSFNTWILRYMYVPLGGRRRALLNAWPIFVFVALWHEPEPHLLLWAAAICVFLLPEAAAAWACRRWGVADALGPRLWRHARAAGVAANIGLMGLANAVGYVFGPAGILDFFAGLRGSHVLVLPTVYAVLFSLAHVQLEIRASEARRGICLNY